MSTSQVKADQRRKSCDDLTSTYIGEFSGLYLIKATGNNTLDVLCFSIFHCCSPSKDALEFGVSYLAAPMVLMVLMGAMAHMTVSNFLILSNCIIKWLAGHLSDFI